MIWNPHIGQKVLLWYRNKRALYHGKEGVVRLIGGRIKNVLIEIDDGKDKKMIVVPRGNLKEVLNDTNFSSAHLVKN